MYPSTATEKPAYYIFTWFHIKLEVKNADLNQKTTYALK